MPRVISHCLAALLALLPATCLLAQQDTTLREITVLYTNDEHGWMEGMSPDQGAANLYALWQEREGYSEEGPFLVLSGGDNFTGPAISTWVQGQSMVEVMNAMHYDASAVGNHEFDFGLDELARRALEADYPYLSANTRWRESGKVPVELGILPYTVIEVNGLDIGIIGLTTTSTPYLTNPEHVRELVFAGYEQAVRATVAELAADAPAMTFLIAHVCMEELEPLVRALSDLDIALAGGGHCNELMAKTINDTVVLGGGFHFTAYARATLVYDLVDKQVVDYRLGTGRNRGAESDPAIEAVVTRWADSASASLREVVAWNATPIARGNGLDELIINSWLQAYPAADIAITNRGGIRANLPAGEITLSDLVTMQPFDNSIIAVEIPGRVVSRALREGGRPVVAGLVRDRGQWLLAETGEPLDDDRTYTVLLNSFMYAGGDNFGAVAQANPDGFDTGVNYRQPFYQWLKNQGTSRDNPLRP